MLPTDRRPWETRSAPTLWEGKGVKAEGTSVGLWTQSGGAGTAGGTLGSTLMGTVWSGGREWNLAFTPIRGFWPVCCFVILFRRQKAVPLPDGALPGGPTPAWFALGPNADFSLQSTRSSRGACRPPCGRGRSPR